MNWRAWDWRLIFGYGAALLFAVTGFVVYQSAQNTGYFILGMALLAAALVTPPRRTQ